MDDLERIERARDTTAGLDYERAERDWDDDDDEAPWAEPVHAVDPLRRRVEVQP